ncbi:hypothetical protein ACWFMI_09740 [Nocardiopsis terrae]
MSGFEPTEAQTGVGYNFMTLIDPDAIPYPETDTWSLNYAAETLRTGGQELGSITESMETTWQGLQEHYEAPESETLFAAVGPVATIGEGLEGDLATVATALEELAEAAAEARRKLNSLRIEAQVFVRGLEDRKCWWLTKDEDNDDWSIDTNFGLKSDVNSAWSDFTAAEIACANTITGVFGGANFTNPDDATGADNELVYGESRLIFDPGEDSRSAAHAAAAWSLDNVTEWAGQELNPESVEFDNSDVQAAWDTIALGCVWGPVQGAVTKTGYWHRQNGWAGNNEEYLDNLEMTWTDTALDAGELFGVRNEDGWLYDYRSDDPTENLSWDWWLGNAKNSLGEVWEGHSAWSKRESDPAYTGTHTAINTAMLVTGPVKLGIEVLNLGNGRSGDGAGAEAGPYGGQGWGPGIGESDREIADIIGEGRTPITERLGDVLEQTPTLPPIAPDRPSTPPPSGQPDPVTPTPGQTPTNQGPTQQDSTQQGDARGEREIDASRNGNQRSEDGSRTDRGRQDTGQDQNETDRIRENGDGPSRVGSGDDEPSESRSEHRQDRQNRSDDDQTVPPPRTEDTRTDDGASTTSNNTTNETNNGRGNTTEDSTTSSSQQNPEGGSSNGGGSSGNGGGDGGSPSDPAAGGTGDGSRPPGPKTLAEFEKHRWGDKNDPAAQEAFRRDVEYLVNNDENFRSKYYRSNNYRIREDLKIGLEEWPLPKLHADKETGRLTPLAAPESPNYFGDKTSVRFNRSDFLKGPDGKPFTGEELARRQKLREEFRSLDDLAVDRREKIDRASELDKDFKAEEAKHGKYKENGENHPDLEEAHRKKTAAYHESTKASETFGERSADVAARHEFDGNPLLDKNGNAVMRDILDDYGKKIGEQPVLKPDLEGATFLGRASEAPGNGNAQFDLIYETKVGEIVIIEAKSSPQTSLGSRVHNPKEGNAVDVMQGTGRYVDSITEAMRERGNSSKIRVDDNSKIPGAKKDEASGHTFVSEKRLADYIYRKKKQGKLTYALFKGNPRTVGDTESANGYDYQIFDMG